MANNTGAVIILAYPETIVRVAEEWYSPYLKYLGIGKKDYLKAGHAALVLVGKEKGELEYHDFGRYITSSPYGRVRGKKYDRELDFKIKAKWRNGQISNLNEILVFLESHPELTHGDGKLVASVCYAIDYKKTKQYIQYLQRQGSIRYAAFMKNATNCARFVTSSLLAGVTDEQVKRKLKKSEWFTPSTVGNVVIGASDDKVFEVIEGSIRSFNSTPFLENKKYFFDTLKEFMPKKIGSLISKPVNGVHNNAQWLSGIAAGAWYELTDVVGLAENELRMRRISPSGRIDVDAVFKKSSGLDLNEPFEIIHNSNCAYCTVKQEQEIYCLEYLRDF